jgi:anti-sigma28 factor (negative regulator of flagellin synthesis)
MGISKGVDREPLTVVRTEARGSSLPDEDRYDGSLVAAAFSAAAHLTPARLEKIAKLKSAIAAGTYHVSASDLADALIAAKAL